MRESINSPFTQHKGSCKWSELFVMQSAASQAGYGSRTLVQVYADLDGKRNHISAYRKGNDPDTLLIVDSDNPDLPGMFCHLPDGKTIKPVRYFHYNVYFNSKHLFETLEKIGIKKMPDQSGLAVPTLLALFKMLEVDVACSSFEANTRGMSQWLTKDHRSDTYHPWPTL